MAVETRRARSDARIDVEFARGPIGWALAIFFARYLADALRDIWRGGDGSLGHLANLGAFQLLAWVVALYLVAGSRTRHASTASLISTGLISLAAVLPDDNAAWVGLSALAIYVFLAFPNDRNFRAAALVMLALATQLFWGRILFELIAFKIEVLDARLAAGLLYASHQTVQVRDNLIATAGHQILIYEACTSFHNISIALLAWVSITKFARLEWRPTDLLTAVMLVAMTVSMNSLRLFLMASSAPGRLEYWHTGTGSQLVNASLSALIAGSCIWRARGTSFA